MRERSRDGAGYIQWRMGGVQIDGAVQNRYQSGGDKAMEMEGYKHGLRKRLDIMRGGCVRDTRIDELEDDAEKNSRVGGVLKQSSIIKGSHVKLLLM